MAIEGVTLLTFMTINTLQDPLVCFTPGVVDNNPIHSLK